jgi:hypothetical protein
MMMRRRRPRSIERGGDSECTHASWDSTVRSPPQYARVPLRRGGGVGSAGRGGAVSPDDRGAVARAGGDCNDTALAMLCDVERLLACTEELSNTLHDKRKAAMSKSRRCVDASSRLAQQSALHIPRDVTLCRAQEAPSCISDVQVSRCALDSCVMASHQDTVKSDDISSVPVELLKREISFHLHPPLPPQSQSYDRRTVLGL